MNDPNDLFTDKWFGYIDKLNPGFDHLETNSRRASRALGFALRDAVKQRVRDDNGLLLSGGVDSTTLAFTLKHLNSSVTCFSVGMQGAQDLTWAQEVAAQYELNWHHKILSLTELEHAIKQVVKILKTDDLVSIGVGVVTCTAAAMAKRCHLDNIWSGLGSEELFAGYQRHKDALEQEGIEAVHDECIRGLKAMPKRDLVRDFSLAQHFQLDMIMPFLDEAVMKTALHVHPMLKLTAEENKIILRQTAHQMGVDKKFAYRKKSAAQYGSGVLKGIDTLAKSRGYSTKKEYVQSLR